MRKAALLLPALLTSALFASACSRTGALKVPFTREAPFVPSPVPADFAIQLNENHDTYYARQHIAQVINAEEAMSQTTYTTFRDYNNSVSNKFSQETPLSPEQLQAMWNEVSRHNLLDRSIIWANWFSGADLYKRDVHTLQIRANGRTRIYRATNGFSGPMRPLVLQIEAVRLPITQRGNTRVIPRQQPTDDTILPRMEETPPSSQPAELHLTPESQPASNSTPETAPATPPME